MINIKNFRWDKKKNEQLQKERGISFEQIEKAIINKKILDVIPNPSKNHPGQNVLVIELENYIILVPFVRNKGDVFLKTAFKCRKATKTYLGRQAL